MKTRKILYFSATGNCLYVAKQMGGELISIPKLYNENVESVSADVIGIVFPVFWISVPALIREFLQKVSLDCEYLFAIVTYGDNMFGTIHDLNTIPLVHDKTFDYINAVKMTENYLPMYEMNQEIEKAKGYATEQTLKQVCEEVEQQYHAIPKVSLLAKVLTNYMRKKHTMTLGQGEAADMTVSEDCIQCGQCVKLCPMKNITLAKDGIQFGTRCADCLACVQNCPNVAIHCKKEKSDKRYRHPGITVGELMK